LSWVSDGFGVVYLEIHHLHQSTIPDHFHQTLILPSITPSWFGFCPSVITAPLKPSKQTQILLDTMAKSADDEKQFMDQVMEHFDLLFTRVNDIGEVQ